MTRTMRAVADHDAEGKAGNCHLSGTPQGVQVSCFPNLSAARAGNPPARGSTLYQPG
jgi:hypothetical protein